MPLTPLSCSNLFSTYRASGSESQWCTTKQMVMREGRGPETAFDSSKRTRLTHPDPISLRREIMREVQRAAGGPSGLSLELLEKSALLTDFARSLACFYLKPLQTEAASDRDCTGKGEAWRQTLIR
eukprot:2586400-Rhodomonas_salina.1